MSLQLENNTYVGDIIGEMATLLTLGASDITGGLFHVKETLKGKKARWSFGWVDSVMQSFDSICAVVPQGNVNRKMLDLDLVRFIVTQELCIDENFDTDFADGNGDYEAQTLGDQIADWARIEIDNFSAGLQAVRWSGDSSLPPHPLDLHKHDGVVVKLQALGAYAPVTNETGYHKVPTTVIDATNAIQEIGKVADAMPHLFIKDPARGYKIIISETVANFVKTQIRNNNAATGLTSLPMVNYDPFTGRFTDGSFFGGPVYVCRGLDATVANKNVVMSGLFTDSSLGVAKYGVLRVGQENTLSIKEVKDGDWIRWRSISCQIVDVMPNGSQISMNI